MLLGQRLGRRHQHRLVARLRAPAASRRAATTVLPRPDLPHQQPLHRLAGVEVGVDLVERLQLVAGRLERQRLDPAPDQLARLARAAAPAAPLRCDALARRQDRLVEEQLFERAGARGAASTSSSLSGKWTALTASATPASLRAPAARPAAARARCRPIAIACSTHSRIRCGFSCSVAG